MEHQQMNELIQSYVHFCNQIIIQKEEEEDEEDYVAKCSSIWTYAKNDHNIINYQGMLFVGHILFDACQNNFMKIVK